MEYTFVRIYALCNWVLNIMDGKHIDVNVPVLSYGRGDMREEIMDMRRKMVVFVIRRPHSILCFGTYCTIGYPNVYENRRHGDMLKRGRSGGHMFAKMEMKGHKVCKNRNDRHRNLQK